MSKESNVIKDSIKEIMGELDEINKKMEKMLNIDESKDINVDDVYEDTVIEILDENKKEEE